MHHHNEAELKKKLLEMYPGIQKHQIDLGLEFKEDKDYWIVKLEKGDQKLHTHLERKDADECLDGVECVYLGMQIGQFINNFELLK